MKLPMPARGTNDLPVRLVTLLLVIAAVTTGVFWTFGAYVNAGPGDVGVLLPLEFAATHDLTNFWMLDNAEGPRIVAYGSLVLQSYVSGLTVGPYYAVNLVLIMAAIVAVFLLVRALSGSASAALFALLLFSVHEQWVSTNEWLLGRQYTIALLLGLAAIWVRFDKPDSWYAAALAGLLLALSSLTVDYGLAFSGAIFLDALARRNPKMVFAAVAAAAIFLAARFTLSSGIYRTDVLQCNDMGYFAGSREFCTRISFDPANLAQISYNMMAGLVAIVWPHIPPLLTSPVEQLNGGLQDVSALDAVIALCAFACALWGWRTRPIAGGLLAALILSVAVLCGPVYRLRAMQYGYIAYIALIALGLDALLARAMGRFRAVGAALIAVSIVAFVLVPTLNRFHYIAHSTASAWWDAERICSQAVIYAGRKLRGSTVYPDASAISKVLEANGVAYCIVPQH